jgi:hypothetical protein
MPTSLVQIAITFHLNHYNFLTVSLFSLWNLHKWFFTSASYHISSLLNLTNDSMSHSEILCGLAPTSHWPPILTLPLPHSAPVPLASMQLLKHAFLSHAWRPFPLAGMSFTQNSTQLLTPSLPSLCALSLPYDCIWIPSLAFSYPLAPTLIFCCIYHHLIHFMFVCLLSVFPSRI